MRQRDRNVHAHIILSRENDKHFRVVSRYRPHLTCFPVTAGSRAAIGYLVILTQSYRTAERFNRSSLCDNSIDYLEKNKEGHHFPPKFSAFELKANIPVMLIVEFSMGLRSMLKWKYDQLK